jgi:hypothetical protein
VQVLKSQTGFDADAAERAVKEVAKSQLGQQLLQALLTQSNEGKDVTGASPLYDLIGRT